MRKNLNELKRERDEALQALEEIERYWENHDSDDPDLIKDEINSAELKYYEAEEAIEEYERIREIESFKNKEAIDIIEKLDELSEKIDEGSWDSSKVEKFYDTVDRLEEILASK